MPLCSMTGFGRFQHADETLVQIWEVRSVNSRYLDLKWRLPSAARSLEARLEKIVRRHAARGRVEICLNLQGGGGTTVSFDSGQASALLDTLEMFAQSRGGTFQPDYAALLGIPHLWTSEGAPDDDVLAQSLEAGLNHALEDWNASRRTEAESLARDLRGRFARMADWVAMMSERAPAIKEERFLQVKDRLNEMLAALGGESLDEGRFLQEMVIMADRLDVSEELTRLRSHLSRLEELLSGEDAGRKLDFTLQECFREINTCGNKIQDTAVSRIVVDFKNELEKCREQVQNLE